MASPTPSPPHPTCLPSRRQLQVHQKVVLGRLQLYRTVGPGAPLPAEGALLALADAWAGRAPATAPAPPEPWLLPLPTAGGGMWDVSQALQLQAGWVGRGWEGGSSGGGGLAGRVIGRLEAPFSQLLTQHQQHQHQHQQQEQEPPVAAEDGPPFLPTVPPGVWRALQWATALRRALQYPVQYPVRSSSSSGGGAALPPPLLGRQHKRGAPEAAEAWGTAIERNEMQLLQRHVAATLAAGGGGGVGPVSGSGRGSGSRGALGLTALLMADWVTASLLDPELHPELLNPTAR